MKVLVTGGGGFLGGWVCRLLLERGDRVLAFQRSDSPALRAAGAEVLPGDVADLAALEQAVAACEAVIHVAGKAGAWGRYDEYHATNVTGTENVIAACRRVAVQRLVFTSSPSVVHGGGDIEGGDESLPYPRHFGAAYPATKALAEQRVMAANGPELRTVSLRPHLVWGAGDRQLLPRLLQRAAAGPIRLPGADKLIDTVYVENAARAHLLALAALDNQPACRGGAYFISNAQPLPQGEFIRRLLQAAGVQPDIRRLPPAVAHAAGALCEWTWRITRREDEPPITRWTADQLSTAHWFDISAARLDLGYEPLVSLDEGFERLRVTRDA